MVPVDPILIFKELVDPMGLLIIKSILEKRFNGDLIK